MFDREKKELLFIVEDDEDMRSFLKNILESRNYTVCCYTSGEEFLGKFKHESFRAGIIDIYLPEMHGVEVAWRLRELGEEDIQLIGMSGRLEEWEEDDLYDNGFNNLLKKPFDVEDLIQTLNAPSASIPSG